MEPDSKSQTPAPPTVQASPGPSGQDPVLELMQAQGIPLTRANYVRKAGLEEPLEAEHAGYVQSLQLDDSPNQDDPNRPETEADGLRAGALRLLKARHQSQAIRDRTLELSQSPSSTPATTASGSPGRDPSPK